MPAMDSPSVTQIDSEVRTGDYTANSLLAASTANVPAALTVPVSTIVGRASTGNIAALTPAQARAVMRVPMLSPPTPVGTYVSAGTNTLGAYAYPNGESRLCPIFLRAGTLVRIGIETTVAGGAGSVVRLGIYNDNSGVVGTLLLDAGTFDGTAAPGVKEITISQVITEGTYYLCAVNQGAATPPATLRTHSLNGQGIHVSPSSAGIAAGGNYSAPKATGITGALPATSAAFTDFDQSPPHIFVRY